MSGSVFLRNVLRRATKSEETPSGAGQIFDEKRDVFVTLEPGKNVYNDTVKNEEPKEDLPANGEDLPLDLRNKLNFDTDDTGSIVLYGGAVVSLWLTSAVIGAIDSIPLACILK